MNAFDRLLISYLALGISTFKEPQQDIRTWFTANLEISQNDDVVIFAYWSVSNKIN